MKMYGYVNGQRVELDHEAVEVVIERPEDDKWVRQGWGGKTLLRLLIFENGKRAIGFVSARISGDMRAGSQRGVHLSVTARNRTKDVEKEVHALPWDSDYKNH